MEDESTLAESAVDKALEEKEMRAALLDLNREEAKVTRPLSTITQDENTEGYIKTLQDFIVEMLEFHVHELKCELVNTDHFDPTADEYILALSFGGDGVSIVEGQPFTQANVKLLRFLRADVAPLLAQRCLLYLPQSESHRWTIQGFQALGTECAKLVREGFVWKGKTIRIGNVIPGLDWSHIAKKSFLDSYGANSDFAGYMFEMLREDWQSGLLGKTLPELVNLAITPDRRRMLGLLSAQNMNSYRLDMCKLNPDAEAETLAKDLKNEQLAFAKTTRNVQKGLPSILVDTPLHDTLHAALRIVPYEAKALCNLAPSMHQELQKHEHLKSLGTAIDADEGSINLKGAQAYDFLENVASIVAPCLEGKSNLHDLLVLTHIRQMFNMRNIVGMMSSTSEHTDDTIEFVFEQGKDIFTISTLVFAKTSKMQPYMFAVSRELPVQLFRLQQEWQRVFGCGVDTRQVNSQDSEHLNKIFKDIERRVSDHRRVKGVQQDESKHYRARCYRPFVYERATKVEAVRLGLLNANGQVTGETHKNFHLLPEGSACKMCGKERTSSEHSTICLHPLWSLIDASIQSGSLHTDLHSLLSDEAARAQLVPEEEKEDPKVARLKRPIHSAQKLARAQEKEKPGKKQKPQVKKPQPKRRKP